MPSYVFVGVKVLCERLTAHSGADVAQEFAKASE